MRTLNSHPWDKNVLTEMPQCSAVYNCKTLKFIKTIQNSKIFYMWLQRFLHVGWQVVLVYIDNCNSGFKTFSCFKIGNFGTL